MSTYTCLTITIHLTTYTQAVKNWEKIVREAPRIEEKLKPLLKARAATIRATLRGHTEHVQVSTYQYG